MDDIKIIAWLDGHNFTDRVDVSAEVSLFEHGIIRNPKTDRTILALTDGVNIISIDWYDISLDDIKEELEKVESGFYAFIGSTKKDKLAQLSNEWLTPTINELITYCNPWDSLDYNLNKEDIVNIIP